MIRYNQAIYTSRLLGGSLGPVARTVEFSVRSSGPNPERTSVAYRPNFPLWAGGIVLSTGRIQPVDEGIAALRLDPHRQSVLSSDTERRLTLSG